MKLDRTKYFIRGNNMYPELVEQFFKEYKDWDIQDYAVKEIFFIDNNTVKHVLFNEHPDLLNKTILKLPDLAIKNDLGEEYAPKMKEFFEKLGAIEYHNLYTDDINFYFLDNDLKFVLIAKEIEIKQTNKVPILLSDWLGVEVPKEKTESLTAFEAEVLEKTKRRTFKIESFKNKITKEQQHIFIPYQLCPKCNGSGQIKIPFGTTSNITTIQCDVCNGQKIIPMFLKQ